MPQIEKHELPPAADGSQQWVRLHMVPTHGMAKRITRAHVTGLSDGDLLGIETVVVRELVAEILVKDDEGREVPWNDGEAVEDLPEPVAAAIYQAAMPVINGLFPENPRGNRAGRRQAKTQR